MILAVALDGLATVLFASVSLVLFAHFRRQPRPERRHIATAFAFVAFAFGVLLVEDVVYMGTGTLIEGAVASKIIDTSLMVAVVWFFLFLTDFMEELKRYLPVSLSGLVVVVALIAFSPVKLVKVGSVVYDVRSPLVGAAIVVFWFAHFVVGCYVFWRYGRFLEEREVRIRAGIMTAGITFAVLAYPIDIVVEIFFPQWLFATAFITVGVALLAGVLFLLGAETPKRLRRLLAK